MTRFRVVLAGLGVLVMAYGAWRILGTARLTRPRTLGVWLVGAVAVHDGLLAPVTMALGYLVGRAFSPRARRYVSGGLVTAAMVTAVAIPLIHRRGSQPTTTTLETQAYTAHLSLIVGAIAALASGAYAVRVLRDRQRTNDANERSSDDQVSSSE